MIKPGNLLFIQFFAFPLHTFYSLFFIRALYQMGNPVRERFEFLEFQLLKWLIIQVYYYQQQKMIPEECAEVGMLKKALGSLKGNEQFISKQIKFFLIPSQNGLFVPEQKLIQLTPQAKVFTHELKMIKVILKQLNEHKKKNCLCFSEDQLNKCKQYIKYCKQLEDILYYSKYKIQNLNFLKERSQKLRNSTGLTKLLDLVEKKRIILQISASQSLNLLDKREQIIKQLLQIKNNISEQKQRLPSKQLKQQMQIQVKNFFNEIKQINMQVKGLQELERDIYEMIKD